MNETDILVEFERNLTDYFTIAKKQRDEIARAYAYMDCHRVEDDQRTNSKKRKSNITLLPAIVRAVAGSEVMQERHIDIVPSDNEGYNIEADVMDGAVSYAQYASSWKHAYDITKRDAAVCGIAATASFLDMTSRDAVSGIPNCKRIFPSYLFYDTSGRGQDLNRTANWCGYVDPMKVDDLEKYVAEKIGDKFVKDVAGSQGGLYFVDEFMNGGRGDSEMRVDMLYHYFWRENEPVRDTENPLYTDETFNEVMANDDVSLEMFAMWCDDARVDRSAPFWVLSQEQFKELKKTLKAIEKFSGEEFQVKSSSRFVKCYYRAEIGLGYVLSYSKSYSQNEYPLNFVTGYFDERMGVFYGFVRPLSFVQDAINLAMDDLLDYAGQTAQGGKVYAKGAADDIRVLQKSRANGDDITPISASTEIIPKEQPSSPQVLLSTVQMLIELMPRAIGVGQEFLGVITSGDMTDSLFGKVMRQAFAVLQDYANSSAGYSKRQGQLFIDMMLSIVEVEDGRILPVLAPGHQEEDYIKLSKQNLARKYTIRIVERPVTDDERMENMKVLMQLAPSMAQAGKDISPAIIENMRIDHRQKEALLEMITPQPQQPDPLNVALSEANVRLLNAQSAKLEADAAKVGGAVDLEPSLVQSETDKNTAAAIKSMAEAGAVEKDLALRAMQSLTQTRGM